MGLLAELTAEGWRGAPNADLRRGKRPHRARSCRAAFHPGKGGVIDKGRQAPLAGVPFLANLLDRQAGGSVRAVDSGLTIGRLRVASILDEIVDDGLLADMPLHRPVK